MVASACGIPLSATAVSINVTVANPSTLGRVTVYPGDGSLPATSTLNFLAGLNRANNGIFPLSADGEGTLRVHAFVPPAGQVDVIIDVNGYFE